MMKCRVTITLEGLSGIDRDFLKKTLDEIQTVTGKPSSSFEIIRDGERSASVEVNFYEFIGEVRSVEQIKMTKLLDNAHRMLEMQQSITDKLWKIIEQMEGR